MNPLQSRKSDTLNFIDADSMLSAFKFSLTKEGHDFWMNIYLEADM